MGVSEGSRGSRSDGVDLGHVESVVSAGPPAGRQQEGPRGVGTREASSGQDVESAESHVRLPRACCGWWVGGAGVASRVQD